MTWTIRRKLSLTFSLIAVMILSGTAFEHLARSRAEATQRVMTSNDSLLYDLQYLIAYVRGVTVVSRAYLISGDERDIAGIPAMRSDADAVAVRVQAAIAGDPEQVAHFGRYLEAVRQRRVFVNKENAARKEQGFEAAKAVFDTGEDTRLLNVIEGEFAAMKAAGQARMKETEEANQRLQRRVSLGEIMIVALSVLLLAGIAVTLTRSIVSNVQIAVDMVGALAQKDLSGTDGQPASSDELAEAIRAINCMKGAMTNALVEVAHSSSQVTAAGAEIESTTRQIAETTHVEQRNVEHFASSLAEMSAAVRDVAEHSERAAGAAGEAVSTAISGRDLVRDTQAAMRRISESVHKASTDMATLGQETQSIGDVVKMIQEIAGQTNLLALNAAIEAARAGEQGKGFAVVAQEVRVLAERTTKFTEEIAAKVRSVQEGAVCAVESMRQGEAVVSDGVGQFNRVSSALDAITQRVETAQQGIAMIATATTQQSSATAGLTETIHMISNEVCATSQQVDQAALACAELAHLAAGLQQVVDGFRLPRQRPEVMGNGPERRPRRAA